MIYSSSYNRFQKSTSNNQNIEVTVFCIAYNHEKYIRYTLDSFIKQKTTFKYEVIIHEDASTDNTASIIKEYQQSYPDIIKPIFQTENQYQHNGFESIFQNVLPFIKGRYVAFCECDDYWCDENKLQSQYEAMIDNPDVAICTHNVQSMSETGQLLNQYTPRRRSQMTESIKLSSMQYADTLLARACYFHTSSFMVKKEVLTDGRRIKLGEYLLGDATLLCTALLNGGLYYIDDVMSYRRLSAIDSWSSTFANKNKGEKIIHAIRDCDGYLLLNKLSDEIYYYQILQKIYVILFGVILHFGEYRTVNDYIVNSGLKFKINKAKRVSASVYIRCIMLSYVPWLCIIAGSIYRTCKKIT